MLRVAVSASFLALVASFQITPSASCTTAPCPHSPFSAGFRTLAAPASAVSSSALLGSSLSLCVAVKRQPVEIDWLLAGLAAAGPALEQGLEQEDRLREGQAGRW